MEKAARKGLLNSAVINDILHSADDTRGDANENIVKVSKESLRLHRDNPLTDAELAKLSQCFGRRNMALLGIQYLGFTLSEMESFLGVYGQHERYTEYDQKLINLKF